MFSFAHVVFCLAEDTARNLFQPLLKSWQKCTCQLMAFHHRFIKTSGWKILLSYLGYCKDWTISSVHSAQHVRIMSCDYDTTSIIWSNNKLWDSFDYWMSTEVNKKDGDVFQVLFWNSHGRIELCHSHRKIRHWHSDGSIEEDHEKPLSGSSLSQRRFEPDTPSTSQTHYCWKWRLTYDRVMYRVVGWTGRYQPNFVGSGFQGWWRLLVDNHLQDHSTSQPRRPLSISSPSWEPQITTKLCRPQIPRWLTES
jgi:hypothetical protein